MVGSGPRLEPWEMTEEKGRPIPIPSGNACISFMVNTLLKKYMVQPRKEFFDHFACYSTHCCDEHK
jgi:hypothetical protein